MDTLLTVGGVFVVGCVIVSLVWFAWEIKHGEEGYQDATGYHSGRPR